MSYSVIEIANKIIANTKTEEGELISNLKLQKLLYYMQGFFMAIYGEKLFVESIEAWQYGPVVAEAYSHFKHFGSGAITLEDSPNIIELEEEKEKLFQEVMNEYGQFSAVKLMNMTHDESPWKNTFYSNPKSEITSEKLIDYFKTQIIE